MTSEVKATSIVMLQFVGFPAYLVVRINGGYKLIDLDKCFGVFEQRMEAKCPFAGGWADMSAQKAILGKVRAKANLRLPDTNLTVRVDDKHGGYHLDIERDHRKIEKSHPVTLSPGKPELLAAFEMAKNELLQRASAMLPNVGSHREPTLDLLQGLWETKYSVCSSPVQMLLPPYPGANLILTVYPSTQLPLRVELKGVRIKLVPFDWDNHTTRPDRLQPSEITWHEL